MRTRFGFTNLFSLLICCFSTIEDVWMNEGIYFVQQKVTVKKPRRWPQMSFENDLIIVGKTKRKEVNFSMGGKGGRSYRDIHKDICCSSVYWIKKVPFKAMQKGEGWHHRLHASFWGDTDSLQKDPIAN